jgi:hypothetical protein
VESPEQWKESIIPIHKKGDKTDCNNYRGISFLSTAYKILSNFLLARLTPYVFSSSFSFSLWLFYASDFFFLTYGSFRHFVGLLGRGISPAPRPLPAQDNTTQHRETQILIHAPSRIRNCDPNFRPAKDSNCLRPRGH